MSRSSERSLFVIRRQIRIARALLVIGFLLVAGRGAVLPYLRVRAEAAQAPAPQPATQPAPQRVASVPPATTAGLSDQAVPNEPPVVAPPPERELELKDDEQPVAAPAPLDPPPTPRAPAPRLVADPRQQPPLRSPGLAVAPPPVPPARRVPAPTPAIADPPMVSPRPRPATDPPRGATPRTRPNIPRPRAAAPVEPPVVAPDPAPEDLVAAQPPTSSTSAPESPQHSATAWQGAPPAEMLIVNPAENAGVVRFLLDSETVALRPGDARTFAAERPRVILFHRGGPFRNAGYTLMPGRYLFQVTSRGWELFDDPRAGSRAAR